MLTDMYEDIPFTEAIYHDRYPYPKYDDSESVVYPGILAMLDEAIAKKNDAMLETNPTMGKYDMFMNGDYEKVGRASSGETNYSVKYEGLPCGYKPATANVPLATTSRYYQAYDDPVYLMNAAEINFLVAEAYARLENAPHSSFNRWTPSDGKADSFIAAGGPYAFNAVSTDAMLKSILTQKWISYAKALDEPMWWQVAKGK